MPVLARDQLQQRGGAQPLEVREERSQSCDKEDKNRVLEEPQMKGIKASLNSRGRGGEGGGVTFVVGSCCRCEAVRRRRKFTSRCQLSQLWPVTSY